MQGSFWKTVAVVGVIGIGSLAILEVQHRLPRQNAAKEDIDAETLAAELITTDPAGNTSVNPPTQQSEFDRLMAAADSGSRTMPQGGFDMSEPPVDVAAANENSPFFGGEPVAPQDNTPPVNTQVNAAALAQGGNPFGAESPGGVAPSGTVSANYQGNANEPVQTVGFTEVKPFVGDDAAGTNAVANGTQPGAPGTRPFRREGIAPESEGVEVVAEEATFSPFAEELSATVDASVVAPEPASLNAAPNDTAPAAMKFFGGDDSQPAAANTTAGPNQSAQFYGSPADRLQPPPDNPLAAPFSEDTAPNNAPLSSNSVQPAGGAEPDPFGSAPTLFSEDGGPATSQPFEGASPAAAPADRSLETVPFEEDTVPIPPGANPMPIPEPQPGGFGSGLAPAQPNPMQPDRIQPNPDRTFETPSAPEPRPSGRRVAPGEGTALPFAEDVEPDTINQPGRFPDSNEQPGFGGTGLGGQGFRDQEEVINTPPLSIPVPGNSFGPEPPEYQPRNDEPNRLPEPNRFDENPFPAGPNDGIRGGGERGFDGNDREFPQNDRGFGNPPMADPGFDGGPREFNGDIPDYRNDPRGLNGDRNFGSDGVPDRDDYRRDLGNDDRRTPDSRQPFGNRRSSDIRTVAGVMRPNLVLEKTAPKNASVGSPLDYNIFVRNEGDATAYDVVVEDDVTAGADVVGAAPDAKINRTTKKLMWTFDKVEPGETKEITVRVIPTGEGTLDGVATVHSKSRVKATTVITAPKLRLQMAGPDAVRLGEEVAYRYVITNEGSGEARDVYVRTLLPEGGGLKHPAGNDIEYEVQSLQPGDQREIVLTVVAVEPGDFRAKAEVTAAGGAKDQAAWQTNIIGAQLNIVRRGPKRRFVSRSAKYENIISNETNVEAFDAKIVETVPDGMKFMGASRGGRYDKNTREVTWRINRLGAGKQETFQIELMPTKPGSRESVVRIFENAGLQSDNHVSTTVVEDLHNVSADISRLDGPVALGETFGFTITVENRGTADATDVELLIDVPAEIKVLAAGNREVHGFVHPETNQVSYQMIGRIGANQRKTFEVKLQGTRPVSNKIVEARIQYDQMASPLKVSESVTVYEERN